MKCDFCNANATYDVKTLFGCWAFVCEKCRESKSAGIKMFEKPLLELQEKTK